MGSFRRSLRVVILGVIAVTTSHLYFNPHASAFGGAYRMKNEVRTELYEASRNGNVEAVSQLLTAPFVTQFVKNRALLFAAETGHLSVVELLLIEGASPLQPREDGSTPLFMAAQNGHLEVVKLLIRKGADVNYPRHDGVTPLLIATNHQHDEIIKILVEEEADPLKAPLQGPNCMSRAYELGRDDLAQLLLEAKISECPICLEPLKCSNRGIYVTPCNHRFHFEECADRVLRSPAPKCPLCNQALPSQTEH
jgi:hypothetical protein